MSHLGNILQPLTWDQDEKQTTCSFQFENCVKTDVDYLKRRLEFTISVTKHRELSYIVSIGGEIKPDKCSHTWNPDTHILNVTLVKSDQKQVLWETCINGEYRPKGEKWDDIGRTGDELEEVAPTNGFNDWMIRQVLKGASDEQKRAVMKSIQESNGTVISTDWNDVGNKFVAPQSR